MEMQIGRRLRKRVVLTRSELLKVSAFLQQLAETAPARGPGAIVKEEVVLVDVRVFLGGGTWWFLPAEFKITSSDVVFSNESEASDIKLKFSSNLVNGELEIPARATATLNVGKGADNNNTVDLYARKAGSAEQWKKIKSGTGNGAEMKINNP
ncbi:MAG: hypothetical protein MUC56_18340 [Thermoanaerobaculales bacterium]|jgi:hypothetical protein|nr:hypothetical protein [Thermoanaerobaculales bacterium]